VRGTMRWACIWMMASAMGLTAQQMTDAGLDTFAWLSGRWLDLKNGTRSEEIWSPPAGDSMMGVWRLVNGGSARIFEFAAITKTGAGVLLSLRHFDSGMTPRESEKEHPARLTMVSQREKQIVFEGMEATGKVRLSYRRTDDTLTVVLEKGSHKEEFHFHKESN
jgi:hypothetical protein